MKDAMKVIFNFLSSAYDMLKVNVEPCLALLALKVCTLKLIGLAIILREQGVFILFCGLFALAI
jgi:hypothetical protein